MSASLDATLDATREAYAHIARRSELAEAVFARTRLPAWWMAVAEEWFLLEVMEELLQQPKPEVVP